MSQEDVMLVQPGRPRGVSAQQKVVVVPFAENMVLSSSGVLNTYEYVDLDSLNCARLWGPSIEKIIPHTKTAIRTANSRWKVVFWWSVDGDTWSGPVDLFTEISATGQLIQAAFTDETKFGLHMRYSAGIKATTATVESVTMSGALAFIFRT